MTGEVALRLYQIEHNPSDLDPGYAVREVWIVRGQKDSMLGPVVVQGESSLECARHKVPAHADCLVPRSTEDDPRIVEMWM